MIHRRTWFRSHKTLYEFIFPKIKTFFFLQSQAFSDKFHKLQRQNVKFWVTWPTKLCNSLFSALMLPLKRWWKDRGKSIQTRKSFCLQLGQRFIRIGELSWELCKKISCIVLCSIEFVRVNYFSCILWRMGKNYGACVYVVSKLSGAVVVSRVYLQRQGLLSSNSVYFPVKICGALFG